MNHSPPASLILLPRPVTPLDALSSRQKADLVHRIETEGLRAAQKWAHIEYRLGVTFEDVATFHAWHQIALQLQEDALRAKSFAECLNKSPLPQIDLEIICFAAQAMLELQSFLARDKNSFLDLRKIRQKDRALDFTARKTVILEQRDSRAKEAEDPLRDCKLSAEEQDARMRQIFGLVEQGY